MKNLIIFASGTGTNAREIIHHFHLSGTARVKLIVCNNPKAGVLEIARKENIPSLLITRSLFYTPAEIPRLLTCFQPDLIVLAGFLWKVPEEIVRAFPDKIINIHPALLPKYGGKGMFGSRVHEAVINAGDTESGITIHVVNEQYDEGKIILQQRCTVTEDDTPESLAQKVHQLEYKWYAETIEKLLLDEK